MFGMLQVGSRWIWKFLAYQHPCMGYILTDSAAKHCSDVILELRLSVSQSVSAMVAFASFFSDVGDDQLRGGQQHL